MPEKRKRPEGSVVINLTLEPGTDEYSAYVSIKNKYQDEMDKRRKANPNRLWKTDAGTCEIIRGSLFALNEVPQEDLPNYIDSAWKPKGRHPLKTDIDVSDQMDSETKLNDRATHLH